MKKRRVGRARMWWRRMVKGKKAAQTRWRSQSRELTAGRVARWRRAAGCQQSLIPKTGKTRKLTLKLSELQCVRCTKPVGLPITLSVALEARLREALPDPSLGAKLRTDLRFPDADERDLIE